MPRRTLKCILCTLIISLNIVLLVVCLCVTIHRMGAHNSGRQYGTRAQIQHSVNQSLVRLMTDHQEKDVVKLQQEFVAAEGTTAKPAAHCGIRLSNLTGDVPVLSWDARSFFQGGMTYTEGAMIVPNAGYYFVYSQLLYSGSGTQELDYGRIIHSVVKQKASELEEAPTPLMRNLQSTPSIRRGRLAYTTSSLGATFFLEANTRVKVMSSVPKNIVYSPCSSYFGLYLV